MQKLVDGGEIDSISVSSPSMNDGKEIIVAQKKRARQTNILYARSSTLCGFGGLGPVKYRRG